MKQLAVFQLLHRLIIMLQVNSTWVSDTKQNSLNADDTVDIPNSSCDCCHPRAIVSKGEFPDRNASCNHTTRLLSKEDNSKNLGHMLFRSITEYTRVYSLVRILSYLEWFIRHRSPPSTSSWNVCRWTSV